MAIAELGKRITDLRNKKKLTQAELAEQLNVSAQAISKWETNIGFPDVQIIPQIAHVLETTTDYLLGCIKKQQKLFVWNVQEREGRSCDSPRKCMIEINDKYLSQGWHIVQSHLSSEKESTYIMIVIEKND